MGRTEVLEVIWGGKAAKCSSVSSVRCPLETAPSVTTADTIDHATLERLVEAGAVRGAHVVGQPGGWGVVVQYGMTERVLAARRGTVRVFRKFETLAGYLKGIGILQYQVDARGYDPVALKVERTRSDASQRMKAAHEAAAKLKKRAAAKA